jgi:polyphosphate kinase 2 (PPK2 family)
MWCFWRILPSRGKIGIFFHSWYRDPVLERVLGQTTDADRSGIFSLSQAAFAVGTLQLEEHCNKAAGCSAN